MRHAAFLAIMVAVGLVAGACGDGEEALTKAEFIEQGNAICARANAQLDPIIGEFFDIPDDATQQEFAGAVVETIGRFTPIFEAQLADLRELAAPEEDEDTLELLFDDLEAALEEGTQLAKDAEAGDQAAMDHLESEDFDPFADVNRRAIQYGPHRVRGGIEDGGGEQALSHQGPSYGRIDPASQNSAERISGNH